MRILAVGLDEATRRMLEAVASSRGHEVVARPDAESAIAAQAAESFAMVIVHWRPGGVDGPALCRRLRALPGGADPTLVVWVAPDDPLPVTEAVRGGATTCRPTPTDGAWIDTHFAVLERALADGEHRRQVEDSLRRSEANFRSLIERLPILVAVGYDERVAYFNAVTVSLLGYDGPEQLGRPRARELFHPDDGPVVEAGIAAARRGERVPTMRVRLLRRDGGVLPVEGTFLGVQFDGRPAVMGVAYDLSDRARLQAQLLLADRLASMGRLAAAVAHEINTPLACVIGNLARLEEHAAAQAGALPAAVRAELAEALRDVREGAEHVWTIARDLRAFAHPAADRPEPVDVRKVLATTLRLTRGEICPRARLVERITEVPRVAAHESRLVQVFLNLLVNAAEALPTGNPDGNEVVVRTAIAPDGRVLVEIRDSGCGIPPENLGRVFDPFFTTKPVGVGTGLGLPICRSIVSDLGGEVLLQSEVGRGTTARVLLPSAAPAGSAGTTSAPDRSGPPRRGRVLVVDDEPAVGRFLRPALAQEHEVDVATGAREALDLVVSGARYDAILCDLVMPRMTGMELHAALARVAPEQAERVVFLSGGALTSEAQAFLERAGQRRLDKPVDLEDLRATVRALVR